MSKQGRILLTVCAVITALCILLLCIFYFRPDKRASSAEPDTVSLPPEAAVSRYTESGEYLAAREWQDFIASYDPDGSILQSSVAEGGMDYAGDYTMYRVYSKELAEKLEEIASRCRLVLHRSMSFCYGGEELCSQAGTGAFLPENCECVGYIYDNGSFHFEGGALRGEDTVAYQFDRQMKGVFSETPLNVAGEGEEVIPFTADGAALSLVRGAERCLIHAELPLSYVTVTVPVGAASEDNPNGITAEWLEDLAGSFRWSEIG